MPSICASKAAEKIIRAVLTSEGTHAGIKHLLDEMVDLVPDANPIKPKLRAIEHLAAYATTYRYPTSSGRIKDAPQPTDLAKAITDVDAALADALARFGVDVKRPEGRRPARRPDPVGPNQNQWIYLAQAHANLNGQDHLFDSDFDRVVAETKSLAKVEKSPSSPAASKSAPPRKPDAREEVLRSVKPRSPRTRTCRHDGRSDGGQSGPEPLVCIDGFYEYSLCSSV